MVISREDLRLGEQVWPKTEHGSFSTPRQFRSQIGVLYAKFTAAASLEVISRRRKPLVRD